jgi:hypothetical protein
VKRKKVIEGYEIVKKRYIIRKSQKITRRQISKIDTTLLIDLDTVVSKHQTIKY